MALIKADLTAVNRAGYLKASLAFLRDDSEGERAKLQPGDSLTVRDLFGDEELAASVVAIDGDTDVVLLEVAWDDEVVPAQHRTVHGSFISVTGAPMIFKSSRIEASAKPLVAA